MFPFPDRAPWERGMTNYEITQAGAHRYALYA